MLANSVAPKDGTHASHQYPIIGSVIARPLIHQFSSITAPFRKGLLVAGCLISSAFGVAAETPQSATATSAPLREQTAQSKQVIDLETAILISLRNNPGVRIGYFDIDAAEGRRLSASGEFDWNTFAEVNYEKNRLPLITLSDTSTLVQETIDYTVGLSRKFRNGLTLRPTVNYELVSNSTERLDQTSRSALNLELIVPLLRGFGDRYNRAIERSAASEVKSAQEAYLQILSNQGLETLNAYWQYSANLRIVEILEDIEARADDLIDQTNALIDAEFLSASVLPQVQANANDRRIQSVLARTDQTQAQYEFARVLGLLPEEMLNIPETAEPPDLTSSNAETILNLKPLAALNLAMNRRHDLQSARSGLEATGYLVEHAKLDLKPQLDFEISGGYAGGDTDRTPLSTPFNDLKGPNIGLGLNYSIPVKNRYRRGTLAQRRSEFDTSQQTLLKIQQTVASETMSAVETLHLSMQRMHIAQDTARQYMEAVDIVNRRFAAGSATVFEVIDMEGRYARSLIGQVNAERDYLLQLGNLRFQTGTIFEKVDLQGNFTLNSLTNPDIFNEATRNP